MELDTMGLQGKQEHVSGNARSGEPLGWEQLSREIERRHVGKGAVVEPLRYPSAGGEDAAEAEAPAAEWVAGQEWAAQLEAKEAEWKARCEAVRQEALAQGRAEVEGRRMEMLAQCAGQWSRAVEEFRQARESYFARVEREVVELSLAIAARILQREAHVDPLLLAGAVRVALGQLQASTTVELRVPASAHEMWSETLRLMPNLPVMPKVVADSEMKDGECVLTTEAGRVDLGVKAQLKEVERGFFDLLSHRAPASGRDAARVGL
ncbi:MAG: FliH/SctL family protein [Acidobacteriaceae bacterium]